MNLTLPVLMILSTLLGLFGCGSTTTLEEGTFEGKSYAVTSTEHKGFSTNSFERSIKLGRLPAIEITASTTDWGPPYSDDLYGTTPFVYTAQHRLPYRNELFDDVHPTNTMLYLSPKRFSKPEFDQYVRFMQTEWPAIDAKYATQPGLRSFPHLIGLVYGRQDDFTRVFEGNKDGKPYAYTIHPDGRIVLGDAISILYSGLSEKVQMPGSFVYLDTYKTKQPSAFTIQQIQQFRDDKGKAITDYFTIIPKATGK